MKIQIEPFGILASGEATQLFHLENDHGMKASVSDYGCTVLSLWVADRKGVFSDIITGYRTFEEWVENPAYFGCIIGRVCNRIGNAKFPLDGVEYKVTPNHEGHQLHGGIQGFNKKKWKSRILDSNEKCGIEFSYLSVDGEEGFPGNVEVRVSYYLTNDNEFGMEFNAVSDKATPVNLTNHCYFNLNGDGSGTIYDQELLILADQITETDKDSIPTGNFLNVKDTAFDFTVQHAIGKYIHNLPKGYDDNYVLRNQSGTLMHGITAYDPGSGREMQIYTTEPGVQLYTSNWFDGSIIGKSGKPYLEHHAFALETQHFPDSVNHPGFPDVTLRPGKKYHSETIWKFSAV